MFRDRHAERRLDSLQEQFNMLENTLGMKLPRLHAFEANIHKINRRIDSLETRMDRFVQRQRMDDEDDMNIAMPVVPVPISVTEHFAEGAPVIEEDDGATGWPVAPPHEPQLQPPGLPDTAAATETGDSR